MKPPSQLIYANVWFPVGGLSGKDEFVALLVKVYPWGRHSRSSLPFSLPAAEPSASAPVPCPPARPPAATLPAMMILGLPL